MCVCVCARARAWVTITHPPLSSLPRKGAGTISIIIKTTTTTTTTTTTIIIINILHYVPRPLRGVEEGRGGSGSENVGKRGGRKECERWCCTNNIHNNDIDIDNIDGDSDNDGDNVIIIFFIIISK